MTISEIINRVVNVSLEGFIPVPNVVRRHFQNTNPVLLSVELSILS
jgi:hypothetical protein